MTPPAKMDSQLVHTLFNNIRDDIRNSHKDLKEDIHNIEKRLDEKTASHATLSANLNRIDQVVNNLEGKLSNTKEDLFGVKSVVTSIKDDMKIIKDTMASVRTAVGGKTPEEKREETMKNLGKFLAVAAAVSPGIVAWIERL